MTLHSRTEANGIVVLEEAVAARAGSLRCAGASHPGLARERNEDRLHIDAARGILVVVDGMGGEAAGETAAETALAQLLDRLERRNGTPEQRVREAITLANNEIFRLSQQNPSWSGMGCVLTLALVENGVVTVGHVGDSRLYRLHSGRIDKLTRDHSPIGMREDAGELSEQEAMRHPRRNEVYRSVGTGQRAPHDPEWIEVLRFPFEREDAILICSDGLSDQVPASGIVRVVREHAGDERSVVQSLVDAANAAGGKDNVTVAFAAGERFAGAFLEGLSARPTGRTAGAARAVPGLRDRRSSFFVLGALSALVLLGAFLFQDRVRNPNGQRSTVLFPTPIGSRYQVGPGRDFKTIGEALASARPGDTVVVAPGRYREQVRLEEGVTLLSGVPGGAVLVPAAEGSGALAAVVIEGLGSGRMAGFKIEGTGDEPLDYGVVIRSGHAAVEDLEIQGVRVAGVAIEGPGTITVMASRIHDNPGAGIVVRGSAAPRLLHNVVIDNGRSSSRSAPGIELEADAHPELMGNIITGNAAEGVRGVAPEARGRFLELNAFSAFGRTNRLGAITLRGSRAAAPARAARGKRP